MLFLDLNGLVLGLSASLKSLYNVLKCKTSEKEKFHDIALIISREIYVFWKKWGFQRFAKKSTLTKVPFSAHVRHTFANIHHSLS